MKYLIILAILFLSVQLLGQEKFLVEGDAKIEGGVTIETTTTTDNGTIRYSGSDIQGRAYGRWHTLTGIVGNENTIVGFDAGLAGTSNTFFGHKAGSRTTGGSNTFIGNDAGVVNTSGEDNTFIGENTGFFNMSGSHNTMVGRAAGASTNASNNTFIGANSGYLNTSGAYNTMVGLNAGSASLTGNSNVYLGANAGLSNKGAENTFIGASAGRLNVGSNNVFIGKSAGYNYLSESNKLIIDNNGNVETPLIYGDFSTHQMAIGTNVFADGHKLSVGGKVACEEVRVDLRADWPDYVFKKDYDLNSLEEVEIHINTYGHLPGVPKAEVVESSGLQLGEMNRILVEKIEELTLYILDQEKRIKELEKAIR